MIVYNHVRGLSFSRCFNDFQYLLVEMDWGLKQAI